MRKTENFLQLLYTVKTRVLEPNIWEPVKLKFHF